MREPLPPRYTDARPLGEGSFAVVYAARDSLLDRPVAVKLLRDERLHEPSSRVRFARELRLAALLGVHAHVVTVHDAGEWCEVPYLVLELLDGTVAERLRGDVSERLALRWLAQAASALDFVHASGVVHRDVKPANLLLDAHGDVRLGDFGVASRGTRDAALTAEGAIVGTPGYVAPEVAAGGVATPASDRYGLAVVASELLGPRPALSGGLAPDPDERYATAGALVAALGAGTETTQVRFRPLRRIAPLPRTQVGPVAVRPAARRGHTAQRGLRLLGAAALAAAAAAGGAVAAVRLAHDGTPQAPVKVASRQTCAVSTFAHNANVVVDGAGAARFCRTQSHVLGLQGNEWTYRSGGELLTPDHGSGSVSVVCALQRRGFELTVYDSGGQSIGRDLCAWYGGAGWRHRSRTT